MLIWKWQYEWNSRCNRTRVEVGIFINLADWLHTLACGYVSSYVHETVPPLHIKYPIYLFRLWEIHWWSQKILSLTVNGLFWIFKCLYIQCFHTCATNTSRDASNAQNNSNLTLQQPKSVWKSRSSQRARGFCSLKIVPSILYILAFVVNVYIYFRQFHKYTQIILFAFYIVCMTTRATCSFVCLFLEQPN